MTIQSAQVAVSTLPVSLVAGGENGVRVNLSNPSGPTVYVGGGTTVSGTTGYQLPGTGSLSLYVEAYEDLYAIAGSGTATVHVLKGGV